MSVREEVKILLLKENKTMVYLAKELGTTPDNLSHKLSKGTLRFEDVERIAEILGYKIIFMKNNA